VPFAALTAGGGARERIRALPADVDRHASKPVDPDERCAVVARPVRRAA
jgi:hypothetical protein